MPQMSCPKCNSQMQSGFILEKSHSALEQSCWINGDPVLEPIKVFGVKLGSKYLSLEGRERIPVRTYRCINCGFLESYAVRGKS